MGHEGSTSYKCKKIGHQDGAMRQDTIGGYDTNEDRDPTKEAMK